MTHQSVLAELIISSEGLVYLDESTLSSEMITFSDLEKIGAPFAENPIKGLLHLGILELSSDLPPSFLFWQEFARKFVSKVCKETGSIEGELLPPIQPPERLELQEIISHAFAMRGLEYLNEDVLLSLWKGLEDLFRQEVTSFSGTVQSYLNHYNPKWNLVGRVCFHLAENKNDEERPFAFLATYTTQLSSKAAAQHRPLKNALQDYAGEQNNTALLSLLLPVQKAASQSVFIKNMVDSGLIFVPQRWTAKEAHRFLKQVPLMESSGVMVRIPNWWNTTKPPRPKVVVELGGNQSASMGFSALLDFKMHMALENGEELTREDWQSLLNQTSGLVKIKGQWVEVDKKKLQDVLSHWDNVQRASKGGLSMAESLRLLAGMGSLQGKEDESTEEITTEWSKVVAGDWLKEILDQLRNPSNAKEDSLEKTLSKYLKAILRPYQLIGVKWLWLLYQLKLGGCLADDMGLGKTIQVLSLLLLIKHHLKPANKKPHLLVVPASLLGNWQEEALRFAPSLDILICHSSAKTSDAFSVESFQKVDLVITTYAYVHRMEAIKEGKFDLVILDEAQLIKNPNTKQTLVAKSLKSEVRITLTGTPVENKLGDLWSLFDFTSPGLLGSSRIFASYAKKAGKEHTAEQYTRFISSLRTLTKPYILRRLKSDKKVIADLPDKMEMQTFCCLSKHQIQLYEHSIEELKTQLQEADGIKRRGLVLSYLMRFKQICNHPTQWLGYGDFSLEESGKFIRLQEICTEIAAKQEKVLVFTQFKEIIPSLCSLLTKIFGREGLSLDGGTAVKKRAELVNSFQQEMGPPFFVLSLKAGGTGLNLTKASHVIHFDRWWNPAVENQATDRAYRIGQKHPVIVHKFICRGTMEEKIDALIASKKSLSQELLAGGDEVKLTELSNEELLNMISLDIKKAFGNF